MIYCSLKWNVVRGDKKKGQARLGQSRIEMMKSEEADWLETEEKKQKLIFFKLKMIGNLAFANNFRFQFSEFSIGNATSTVFGNI